MVGVARGNPVGLCCARAAWWNPQAGARCRVGDFRRSVFDNQGGFVVVTEGTDSKNKMQTQVLSNRHVLSDSLQRSRPEFKHYLRSDVNGLGTDVSQIEKKRLARQMKFPKLHGRQDVDSFKDVNGLTDSAYKKWNDEGDHRPDAPNRFCDNILDPVSGFVSTCGDVDRNTGHTRINPLIRLNHTPQANLPQETNSIRADHKAAPPETDRRSEKDPGAPYTWNSRKVLDSSIRASLGGWTSDTPQTIIMQTPFGGQMTNRATDEASRLRDKLAMKYMYTSSTQRSYEGVPWDTILPNKRWPPTSTLEDRPDMIDQRYTLKRYAPSAEEWQNAGRSWDWFQNRKGYYKQGPMDIVFCSPCHRVQQIPLYSGSIGATNLEEYDNAKEPFTPLTVKRVPIPRPTDVSHRPHIPGYTGCTLYRSKTAPVVLETGIPDPSSSTNTTYKPLPVPDYPTKREGPLSRMVTTVPPCNPFNKVNWTEVKVN